MREDSSWWELYQLTPSPCLRSSPAIYPPPSETRTDEALRRESLCGRQRRFLTSNSNVNEGETGKVRARMQASKPKYSISPCSSAKEKHGNRLRKEASRDREEVVHGYSAFGPVFTLSLQEPELRYELGFVTFKSARCLKDSHNYNDYNLLSHMGKFKTKFSFSGSAKWTGEILDDSFRHPAGYVEIFCGNCPHDMWQPTHKHG